MRVTGTAVSLTVDDPAASAAFLTDHFGFTEQMAADGFASLTPYRRKLLEQIPMGRFADPAEVARIACFLLSDDARYITGQVVQADGGMAM